MERQAEEAFRRGERRFRALTKNAPVGIVELDTDGRCVFVNGRFCELSGIPPEKTAGWGWMGALHPDERDIVLADGRRAARGGEELVREHRMIRSDGRLVWISARTAQLRDEAGTIEGYIVTCTDITELKEANRALEEAEARFANAFEEAPIGMALVSPEGGFLRVNRELVRITGHTQEQLLEMSVQDVSHPDELDESLELVRRLLAGDMRTFSLERRHRRANGQFAWIDLSVSAVRDESGPLYMVAQIEDVTKRRRADEAVRSAEAHFRSAFDSAPIGMAITSLDGRFEHVNPALCEITGYPREQLESMTFQSITPAEDLGDDDRATEQLISGRISVYRNEKRYIHADGHLIPIEISATLVRDSDGQPLNFLTQIQDITERKLLRGAAPAPRRPRLAHGSLQSPPLRGGALARARTRRAARQLGRGARDRSRQLQVHQRLARPLDRGRADSEGGRGPVRPVAEDRRARPAGRRRVRGDHAARRRTRRVAVGWGAAGLGVVRRSGNDRLAHAQRDGEHRHLDLRARLRTHLRGATRGGRHRDVRREGGRTRPRECLQRERGPRRADAGAHHLGRSDSRGARGRPLRALRPGDQVAHRRSRSALRAAASDGERERRGDPAGQLPPRRRALRRDPGDRLLGGSAGRRHPRRAPGRGP